MTVLVAIGCLALGMLLGAVGLAGAVVVLVIFGGPRERSDR